MVKEEALRQGCWKGAQHLFAKISYSVGVYIPSMNSGITISMKVYWPGIRSLFNSNIQYSFCVSCSTYCVMQHIDYGMDANNFSSR